MSLFSRMFRRGDSESGGGEGEEPREPEGRIEDTSSAVAGAAGDETAANEAKPAVPEAAANVEPTRIEDPARVPARREPPRDVALDPSPTRPSPRPPIVATPAPVPAPRPKAAPQTAVPERVAVRRASPAVAQKPIEKSDAPKLGKIPAPVVKPAVAMAVPAPSPTPTATKPDPGERFEAASVLALRPLVDLMLELRAGGAPTAWATRCLPAIRALLPLASELEDASVGAALDAVVSALEAPGAQGRDTIDGNLRDELRGAYAVLADKVRAAVDIEEEHGRRDPVVVDALLRNVEGLHDVARARIYDAGYRATDRFLSATVAELDRETGIGDELSARVIAAFASFRSEFPTTAPEPMRAEELRRLAERLAQLRDEQARFERASSAWSDDALSERRAVRKSRKRAIQSIHLVLARIGEVDRIGALERAPYATKIAELTEYLRAEKSRATAVA
jgi:hypothetical protein